MFDNCQNVEVGIVLNVNIIRFHMKTDCENFYRSVFFFIAFMVDATFKYFSTIQNILFFYLTFLNKKTAGFYVINYYASQKKCEQIFIAFSQPVFIF